MLKKSMIVILLMIVLISLILSCQTIEINEIILNDYERIDVQELKNKDCIDIVKKLTEYINTLEVYITGLIYDIKSSDSKTVIVIDAINE
jgi:hypothetical protein